MDVIWDPAKAKANFMKHGVCFSDAETVLFDPLALSMEDSDAEGEDRYVAIGKMQLDGLPSSCIPIAANSSASFQPEVIHLKRFDFMKKEYDFKKAKRGPVARPKGKTRITIYLDDDVLDSFRQVADEAGRGYQTLINDALRDHLEKSSAPLDEETLRRVIREELKSA